jgi:hypothetical protein
LGRLLAVHHGPSSSSFGGIPFHRAHGSRAQIRFNIHPLDSVSKLESNTGHPSLDKNNTT